jgi:excisionase family DNA binding protein
MAKQTYTADGIAQRYGVHPRTVYKWCTKGLPYVQPRLGPRRFNLQTVQRWLQHEEVRCA